MRWSLLPLVPLLAVGVPRQLLGQEPAVAALAAAEKAAPRSAQAALALGRALRRAGRYEEALRVLNRAAVNAGGQALADEARYEIARVYFDQPGMPGVYHKAHTACIALQRTPPTPLFSVCEARAWNTWHRSSRAIEEAQHALQMDGRNAEAQVALGDAHLSAGDSAEAEAAYRHALEVDAGLVEAHLGLATVLESASARREEMLRELRRAVELDPGRAAAHLALARALGHGDEALRALRTAAEARPTWAEARVALGEALLEANQIPDATAQFREAVRVAADSAPAHTGLGTALLRAGQHAEAERELARALQLVPNDFAAALAMAQLLEATNRADDALEAYRHAADLDGRNPESLLRAALLCRRLGRNTVAMGFLQRALRIDEHLPRAQALMGDILFDTQDFTNAKHAYERALVGELTGVDVAHVRERIQRLHDF